MSSIIFLKCLKKRIGGNRLECLWWLPLSSAIKGDFCLLLYPFLYHPFQAGGPLPQCAQAGASFVLPVLVGYENNSR